MWKATSEFVSYVTYGGDERTFGLILSDPWKAASLSAIYVLLVSVMLPKFMEKRQAYQLKNTILVYNAFQVAVNFYLFAWCHQTWGDVRIWVRCRPIPDISDTSDYTMGLIVAQHWYYMSKYIEWLDTIFFVLRKKYNQVSFLHVYHHASVPILTILGLRFAPSSSLSFLGYLNTVIHTVMYTYYTLAAMGPKYKKYLTWKKYITVLQMIQFVMMMLHVLIVAGSGEECNIPNFLIVIIFANVILYFILFRIFYKKQYKKE